MANSFRNAERAVLSDYIPADKFRTILPEHRHIEGGITEIPVEIHMKRPFAKKLSFNVEWDGILYGFVRGKKDITAKLGSMEKITRITLSDWDDKFQLLFEGTSETEEQPFFVTPAEVLDLIENCRRVPEQISEEKKSIFKKGK